MNVTLINFKELPWTLQLQTRNWRNSENVRKYFQIQHISLNEHKSWLKTLNSNEAKAIAFLIKYNSKPVGVTYFHSINNIKKETDWGIYIYDTSTRGKGVGKKVLNKCIDYAVHNMKMKKIKLEVKNDNFHAIKLYESMEFKFIKNTNECFLQFAKKLNILQM